MSYREMSSPFSLDQLAISPSRALLNAQHGDTARRKRTKHIRKKLKATALQSAVSMKGFNTKVPNHHFVYN